MARVSLKTIAHALGISTMTVSRALRGRAGVSAALRLRICAQAERMEYRPDPAIGRLMHQLRRGVEVGVRSCLCAVTDISQSEELPYCDRLFRHAEERARRLGFRLTRLRVPSGRGGWSATMRTVVARGAEGVLLLPMREPVRLSVEGWDRLSVVAATSSVVFPRFLEVVPNHTANVRLLVEQLVGQGFRRMGFVGLTTHAERTRETYLAALALHHARCGVRCAPYLYAPGDRLSLTAWLRQERPDVVVVGHPPDWPRIEAAVRRASSRPAVVLANSKPFDPSFGGLDERHDLIGVASIDTLVGLIARGERGVPAVAHSLAVTGEWVT